MGGSGVSRWRWLGPMVCAAAMVVVAGCGDDGGGDGEGGGGTSSSSSGDGPCAANACSESSPDAACDTCIEANCATEAQACMDDSQTGSCGGCAEFLQDGSWETTCDDSKAVFLAMLECICGDGSSAGACN